MFANDIFTQLCAACLSKWQQRLQTPVERAHCADLYCSRLAALGTESAAAPKSSLPTAPRGERETEPEEGRDLLRHSEGCGDGSTGALEVDFVSACWMDA